MVPLFLEGSERAFIQVRTINHQLDDKLMLLQNLDGEILELVPNGEVDDEIMKADIIFSKVVDLREQIADFMVNSRVSDRSTELLSDPVVDESVEPKSPV